MTKREAEMIEQLADQAEMEIKDDYVRKDLKEHRALLKNAFYQGSKKLKHSVPKGKRV